jgi:hypothetical protein
MVVSRTFARNDGRRPGAYFQQAGHGCVKIPPVWYFMKNNKPVILHRQTGSIKNRKIKTV